MSHALREYDLSEVEHAMGFLAISEALAFLHNDAALIHGNLSPNSVFVSKGGRWKLGGFHFGGHVKYQEPGKSFAFPEYAAGGGARPSAVQRALQPDLNFLAPEYILTKTCDQSSDLYSFGHLMYACFHRGQVLFECHGNVLDYQNNMEKISRLCADDMPGVPVKLRQVIKILLNAAGTVRPAATDIGRAPYFDSVPLMALRFLASMVQKEDVKKAEFLKGLPRVLPELPKRVVHQQVLRPLLDECQRTVMVPFALPNILLIADGCSMIEFENVILPEIVPLMAITEPIQVLHIFLQKMELLLTKTPTEKADVVYGIIFNALESGEQAVQLLAVGIIPDFKDAIQYTKMKNDFIPRIQALCLKTGADNVRISCLVCMGKLLDVMDKWLVHDALLPMMGQIKQRSPGVVMAVLGIFHALLQDKDKFGLDAKIIAGKIIPFLSPMLVSPGLNPTQFGRIVQLLRELLASTEAQHMAELTQGATMRQAAKDTAALAQGAAGTTDAQAGRMQQLMADDQTPSFDVGAAARAAAEADKRAAAAADEKAAFAWPEDSSAPTVGGSSSSQSPAPQSQPTWRAPNSLLFEAPGSSATDSGQQTPGAARKPGVIPASGPSAASFGIASRPVDTTPRMRASFGGANQQPDLADRMMNAAAAPASLQTGGLLKPMSAAPTAAPQQLPQQAGGDIFAGVGVSSRAVATPSGVFGATGSFSSVGPPSNGLNPFDDAPTSATPSVFSPPAAMPPQGRLSASTGLGGPGSSGGSGGLLAPMPAGSGFGGPSPFQQQQQQPSATLPPGMTGGSSDLLGGLSGPPLGFAAPAMGANPGALTRPKPDLSDFDIFK